MLSLLWLIFLFVALVLYSYAIIGMELFGGYNLAVDSITKFTTFPYAFLSLVKLLAGGIDDLLYATITATKSGWIAWYFISFQIFVGIIILNLLVALILDNYGVQKAFQDERDAEEEIQEWETKEENNQINKDEIESVEEAIPSLETRGSSNWRLTKTMGKNWERELLSGEELPNLSPQMLSVTKTRATRVISTLKTSKTTLKTPKSQSNK